MNKQYNLPPMVNNHTDNLAFTFRTCGCNLSPYHILSPYAIFVKSDNKFQPYVDVEYYSSSREVIKMTILNVLSSQYVIDGDVLFDLLLSDRLLSCLIADTTTWDITDCLREFSVTCAELIPQVTDLFQSCNLLESAELKGYIDTLTSYLEVHHRIGSNNDKLNVADFNSLLEEKYFMYFCKTLVLHVSPEVSRLSYGSSLVHQELYSYFGSIENPRVTSSYLSLEPLSSIVTDCIRYLAVSKRITISLELDSAIRWYFIDTSDFTNNTQATALVKGAILNVTIGMTSYSEDLYSDVFNSILNEVK